jgi:hypothetical protein
MRSLFGYSFVLVAFAHCPCCLLALQAAAIIQMLLNRFSEVQTERDTLEREMVGASIALQDKTVQVQQLRDEIKSLHAKYERVVDKFHLLATEVRKLQLLIRVSFSVPTTLNICLQASSRAAPAGGEHFGTAAVQTNQSRAALFATAGPPAGVEAAGTPACASLNVLAQVLRCAALPHSHVPSVQDTCAARPLRRSTRAEERRSHLRERWRLLQQPRSLQAALLLRCELCFFFLSSPGQPCAHSKSRIEKPFHPCNGPCRLGFQLVVLHLGTMCLASPP